MNREFLLNIFFLLTLNLLIKPFYLFGIDRTIQNTVGESSYGLFATLFDFTFLFYILNDLGIQHYNNRYISQHKYLIGKYLPRLLTLKILLSLLYLAVVGLAGLVMDYPPYYYPILFFVAINHCLFSWVAFLRGNISGLGLYRKDSMLSVLDKLILILVCAGLLWGGLASNTFRIEWLIWSQTLAWVITVLAAMAILRHKVPSWSLKWKPAFWQAILKKSFPFALVFLLMTAYTRVDKVMIERLLENGTREAGIYAAGYRLLDGANMIGYLFAGLLLPMFASMLKKRESVQSLVNLSFQLIISGALTLSLSVFFFREEIMELLYDRATPYYADVMKYLILSFIAVAGIYIFSTLLTANASLRKMNGLFVISILLNISLNYLLIGPLKSEGAAIATLVTQFFVFLGTMYLCKREMKVGLPHQIVFRTLLFTVLLVLSGFFFYQAEFSGWLIRFGCCLLTGGVLAFILRLINLPEIFDLLSKRVEKST